MARHFIRRYLPDPEHLARQRYLRFLGHRLADPSLWHLNRRSAAGAAFIGLWCAFLPMPFQMVPAAVCAVLFRVNLPLSLALVWVSNPLTILPFAWLAYLTGSLLLGVPMPGATEFRQLVSDIANSIGSFFGRGGETAASHWNLSQHLEPLLLGAMVAGCLVGCLGYVLVRLLWRWHVVRAWRQRQQRRATR